MCRNFKRKDISLIIGLAISKYCPFNLLITVSNHLIVSEIVMLVTCPMCKLSIFTAKACSFNLNPSQLLQLEIDWYLFNSYLTQGSLD